MLARIDLVGDASRRAETSERPGTRLLDRALQPALPLAASTSTNIVSSVCEVLEVHP